MKMIESISPRESEIEELFNNMKNEENELRNDVVESQEMSFGGLTLQKNGAYEVPGISESAKSLRDRQFPGVIFGNCRLSKNLGSVLFSDSLVIPKNGKARKEIHKETFYSQKILPGGKLEIPGRHVASDGTVRDKDGYICVAANYIPKGSQIMTTLGPGKVYDTGRMRGKWIDIYVNW